MNKPALSIFLALAAISALGQANQSALVGIVHDPTGAVMPGAKITVRNKGTSAVVEGMSDASGHYRISSLLPGSYVVEFTHQGFQTETQNDVVLNVAQVLEIDPALKTGDVTEVVQVDTTPTPLDTSTATISDVVPARSIEGLPLNVRDPFALVGLTPGVQFGGNFGSGGATDVGRGFYRDDFNVGGGRSGFQEILLDGAPNTTGDRNLNIIDPPVDSLQEFRVQAASYDAQYGRTSGAVVNVVTKSGTNSFHGVAYDFERHNNIEAKPYFTRPGTKPASFARHQFGGDLGGFLWRDRAFFFVDYEGLRQGYPIIQNSIVPTALQRAGDFSQTLSSTGAQITIYDPNTLVGNTRRAFPGNRISRIDPVAAAVIALYPLPNVTGISAYNYTFSGKSITNTDKYDIRVDAELTAKTRMFVRYSRQQDTRLGVGSLPLPIGGGRSVQDHFTQAVVDLNRVFTQTLVADVQFSFGRALGAQLGRSNGFDLSSIKLPSNFTSVAAPQFPVFNIGDITGTSNGSDAIVSVQPRNVYATLGTVYYQAGRHALKFGGDFRNLYFNEGQNSQPAGVFNFNRGYTQGPTATQSSSTSGFGLASFLLGDAASGTIIRNNRLSTQGRYAAVFAQDDWRVNDRLTLNLGLRYDVGIGDREKYNKLAWFDPDAPSPVAVQAGLAGLKGAIRWVGQGNDLNQQSTDWSNLGPRFGFAYKLIEKLVLRGGYGIFYYPRLIAGTGGGAIEAVQSTTMNATTNNGITPADTLSNPYPAGVLAPLNDRSLLANLGQALQIPTHDSFKNGYSQLYSLGIQEDLGHGFVLDVHYWGNKGTHILNTYNVNQLPDQYLSLGTALNQQVPNPFYGIVTTGLLSQKTISRQQSLVPFPQYQGISNVYAPKAAASYNAFTVQVDKRISSGFTLLANYTWSKAMDNVRTPLDTYNPYVEWSYSPFHIPHQAKISFVYALPYGHDRLFGKDHPSIVTAILGDWDLSSIVNLQSGLPVSISRPAVQVSGVNPKLNHPTLAAWFNTAAFTPAPAFTFGNVGPYLRDVRTQPIHNLDAVLSKNFTIIPGDHKVTGTLRAEVFNITNTPQFGFPNNNVTSNSFGTVSSVLNSARELQFAFKLRF